MPEDIKQPEPEIIDEATMVTPVKGESSAEGQSITNTNVSSTETNLETQNEEAREASYRGKAEEVAKELSKMNAEDKSEDDKLFIKPQKVDAKYPIFIPVDNFDPMKGFIRMPSSFEDYVTAKLNNAPKILIGENEESNKWRRAVIEGLDLTTVGDMYRSSLEREDAEWAQSIDANGKALMASAPELAKTSGEALSGERATLRFLKFAGLGSIFSIPLWHTGIWITIKTPSEATLLELNREMTSEKIDLGRATHGLALSAVSATYAEKLVKVAIDHIYTTNLKTDKNLLDVISCHDIDTIIWGLACAIWNNGFQYARGCTHDPEKCHHVVEEKIDVSKLLWVNKNALTPWQVAHMARKRQGEVTMEDVERYQKEMLDIQPRRITMDVPNSENKFYMDLKVPTVSEYFERSSDWIQSVVSSVERALTIDPSDDERNSFIDHNARSTLMRQYSHWVEGIEFDTNVIKDRETIDTQLEWLSGIDETRNKFIDEVKKYINDSAISVIGIPSYTCPNCKNEQKYTAKNDSLYSIIPLDIINTFFYLHVQKVFLIQNR